MKLNDFILVLLKDNPMKVPSVKFWGEILIMIKVGVQIQTDNGHYLTPEDCFKEMEDCWLKRVYEGGWVRAWFEQYEYFRGGDKKRWME